MKTQYKKLPKKFKEKWLKALRGGKYQQCQGALYENGKFCCIGVECHLHGVSRNEMKMDYKAGGTRRNFSKIPKYMDVIVAGRLSETPQQVLINMNDEGKSFKQIATWIQKNL